ncbi:MAG TPA: gluconate 2-dehydrogenase subunit 3 family protein [Bryobacterales bacterium]|nr:gluconate 2-dehydrogenase subunit 3 family protein [Bryobacterales bacterium]
MTGEPLSRREWLLASYVLLHGPEIAAAQRHAEQAAQAGGTKLDFFDRETAAEIEAIAAQIIPTDETPGAREAGVIYFIDRALTTFQKSSQEAYRHGLEEAEKKRAELFPASTSIAALAPDEQLALVKAIEQTPFFGLLRFHTILGFFGDPSYGGNRNQAGWKLIGFEDKGAFEPPFGYYDAHPNEGDEK